MKIQIELPEDVVAELLASRGELSFEEFLIKRLLGSSTKKEYVEFSTSVESLTDLIIRHLLQESLPHSTFTLKQAYSSLRNDNTDLPLWEQIDEGYRKSLGKYFKMSADKNSLKAPSEDCVIFSGKDMQNSSLYSVRRS